MIRIGVDFGGTKIEAAALDALGRIVSRVRVATPGDYDDGLVAVRDLVAEAEAQARARAACIGVCGPGSPSPATGLMRNANSTQLNGRAFRQDLEAALGRPVRYANDADCLALSEAADGAGAGFRTVFAVILGTGVGGGIVVEGRLLAGPNAIAGEWGHTPLPWPTPDETPGPACWCGRRGCLETWLSGPALAREGRADLDQYISRLGRGLAVVCDLIDPDVIVLGGGVSNIDGLYDALPAAVAAHVFSDSFTTPIRPAAHGDSSGVRGAAWLWPLP